MTMQFVFPAQVVELPAPPQPMVSMDIIRSGLAETGILVEHLYQLGLISTWIVIPESLEERLCNTHEAKQIHAALGVPDGMDSYRMIQWLQEEQKFGWLLRADLLMGKLTASPANRPSGSWFYGERLDLLLLEAIRWAKGES